MTVRVTNMAGVDLSTFRFDYDLTFAALLMHGDGTIFHTYAGRDETSAVSHLSMKSLVRIMNETLPTYAKYKTKPPVARVKRTVEQLQRRAGHKKKVDCYHCHNVHDWANAIDSRSKGFRNRDAFRWPDAARVGLRLDRDDQVLVKKLEPWSRSGLKPGDRILRINNERVRTFGDVARILRHIKRIDGMQVRYERGGRDAETAFFFPKDWRDPDPKLAGWRPTKWTLKPAPGFGGRQLTPAQLRTNGLPEEAFAFRVGYLVTWGKNRHTGQNAARAGVRKHDVVVFDPKLGLTSMHHFHAWVRLKKKPGDVLRFDILRGGKRIPVRMKLVK